MDLVYRLATIKISLSTDELPSGISSLLEESSEYFIKYFYAIIFKLRL